MTSEQRAKVTAAIAAAIRYIEMSDESALGRLVISELRSAVGIIGAERADLAGRPDRASADQA